MTEQFDQGAAVETNRMQHLLPGWTDPVDPGMLVKIRRQIHRNPEPGWCEFETTALMARIFSEAGFELKFGPEFIAPEFIRGRDVQEAARAKSRAAAEGADAQFLERMGDCPGLAATYDTGRPGRTLAIRVELDAIYMDEPSDPSHIPAREGFASSRPGIMHACGHDGHLAVASGLAKLVAANRDRLSGRIVFIFQPAEEGSRGAYPILQSDLLKGVDILLCAHLGVDIEDGLVIAAPNKFLCTTKIDFEFAGKPSHAGMQPQIGRNALLAAANAAINVMGLPRHAEGMTRVNVGALHAGEGRNVVPSHATMEVEVRGETAAINRELTDEAFMRARGAAASFGVECRSRIVGEAVDFIPDDSITQFVTVCARRARYCRKIGPTMPYNGSDDGTLLMRRVQESGGRAGYFMVGAALPEHTGEAAVDFDERALVTLYDTYAHLITAFLSC